MRKSFLIAICALVACSFFACKKAQQSPPDNSGGGRVSLYTDSLFFIRSTDFVVKPIKSQSGTYSAVPEGLKIDESTGNIDVNKSETGLKYRVTFTSVTGSAQTSTVIVSGINYEDKIYNLSKGDSIALPIYNSNPKQSLPGTGTNVFDEGGGCKRANIFINANNATINLAATIRNQGIDTGATQQVKMAYRINDGSSKALNGLELKIYFYRNVGEIPKYLTDLIAERKTVIFNSAVTQRNTLTTLGLTTNAKAPARPRPPCIIVVSN